MKDIKVYSDFQCTKELEGGILDFGIVEAGSNKIYEIFIKNESNSQLKELKFLVEHSEVKIIEAPENLNSGEIKKLVIEWVPLVDVEEGLDVPIHITGKKIIKPKL